MENNKKKYTQKMVYHKGGYMPEKYKNLDDKLDSLVKSPPKFDISNKNQVLIWIRNMILALKGNDN